MCEVDSGQTIGAKYKLFLTNVITPWSEAEHRKNQWRVSDERETRGE